MHTRELMAAVCVRTLTSPLSHDSVKSEHGYDTHIHIRCDLLSGKWDRIITDVHKSYYNPNSKIAGTSCES